MSQLLDYVKFLRPYQWGKNLFVLIPAFFAGSLFDPHLIQSLLIGFFCFCIASSSVYTFNDLRDIKYDRLHPYKKHRPLPSGKINLTAAWAIHVSLLVLSLLLPYLFCSKEFFLTVLLFLISNYAYSLGLKNVSIIEMIIVSIGFVIRVFAGGILANVMVSGWLIIMIFLLSLFLTVSKRRDEYIKYLEKQILARKVITSYNQGFLDSLIGILVGVILVSYLMYSITSDLALRVNSPYGYTNSIFVIVGLLRYLQIVFVEKKSTSPNRIFLTDKMIIISMVLWAVSFYIMLYI